MLQPEYTDIMIDFETLSLDNRPVVVSMGAIKFNFEEGYQQDMDKGFYVAMDLNDQIKHGRGISADTLEWWMCQNDEAREVFSLPTVVTEIAIDAFTNWVGNVHNIEGLWARGPSFDINILKGLYNDANTRYPFRYNADRDVRTIVSVASMLGIGELIGDSTQAHNALYDAHFQTRQVLGVAADLRDHYKHWQQRGPGMKVEEFNVEFDANETA